MTDNLDRIIIYSVLSNIPLKLDNDLAKLCCEYPNLELLKKCTFTDTMYPSCIRIVSENRLDIIIHLESCTLDTLNEGTSNLMEFYMEMAIHAAMYGSIDILKYTMGNYTTIHQINDILDDGVRYGHLEVVKYLLPISTIDIDIKVAYIADNVEIFKLFADINVDPNDYVMRTSHDNSVNILKYLVQQGATIPHGYIYPHHHSMRMIRYLYEGGFISQHIIQEFILLHINKPKAIRYFHSKGELKECKEEVVRWALLHEDYTLVDEIK